MDKKADVNLLDLPFGQALRCRARSKRTGLRCAAPAVKGWSVCRLHGAGGGAPSGMRNGAYKHGRRTKEAMALRKELTQLSREARRQAREIEQTASLISVTGPLST